MLAAGLEAEREAAEQAEAAKAEEFRARQRAGQRTGCSPDSAAMALAQEKLARVTVAQQAKIDDWQARNAASLAATGKPLRNPPRQSAGGHCRVKEAAAQVGTPVAAATEQIGRFLRSQILRDISRARQRVDRPALSGALGGSPGGAGGHG